MGISENVNGRTIAVATSPPDSVAIQDSSIFGYISNLSPIKPGNAAPVVPGFPGLSSPPIVFTSPHINPLEGKTHLKRSQCPQLSCAEELCQQDVRGKKIEIGPVDFEKSKSPFSSNFIPCIAKECDNKGSVQDQTASPSVCIDPYWDEEEEEEEVPCENYAHSASLSLIQSDDMPPLNDCTNSKGTILKCDNKNDMSQDVVKATSTCPATLELPGQNFQRKSSFGDKPVETAVQQGGSEMPSSACLEVESGSSLDHASEEQNCEFPTAQPIQGCEDCGETTRECSGKLIENMVLHDPRAQYHLGMPRRCLQFEEAQQNIMENSADLWSPSNVVISSMLPVCPADLEAYESSLEKCGTSSCRQLAKLDHPTSPMNSPRNCGNSRSTVSKPSGIGLHLNSIVNSMQMGCGVSESTKSAKKGYLNIQERKFISINGCHQPENTKNGSILLNVRERLSASSEGGIHETRASIATISLASQSPQIVISTIDPALLKQNDGTTTCGKRKSISEHAQAVEELNQSNPKKKRRKVSATNDDDGCKRCNCKKTKCLKLYCDCFAAGIYCDEPCSCQECFNRPEYEDTVLETRQLIESRNPLAFAPRIVKQLTGSLANSNEEDGNDSTPSSARHKRGCNCKKSLCSKKYCECYQANVGCSSGCRCEGCKNVYGKKEEYGITENMLSKRSVIERFKYLFDEKQEMVASRDGLLQTELCNHHNSTPPTPTFQFLDHGKYASRSQFSTRRCLPIPGSNITFLPKSPAFPGTSENHDIPLKAWKDIQGIVSCHHKLEGSNAETMNESTQRYDRLPNGCDLNTLPNPPSTAMHYSASSRISDRTTISGAQLCPGNDHLSSLSSLRWRSSAPVAEFGGTKHLQAVESDEKLHDTLEDDMPEILKDALTPPDALRFRSPNKKRVSPPHRQLYELGSSSSADLRNGRKFILQAMPSFPPLTP